LINSVERQLSNQPLSGRKVPELSGKCQSFLKEVVFKGYRIIYNPAKAPVSVTIVAVLSSKMHILNKSERDGSWSRIRFSSSQIVMMKTEFHCHLPP